MRVSSTITDLTAMTAGQAEQLHCLEDVWPEYGHALQVTAATGGGMAFRTVHGVDYLTRYTQVDGKKQARSLGRRSPETEAILKHFEESTLKSRRILKEKRDDVALMCRLAKAHGVARLPGRQAETLEWLWYTDATRRLALFGGAGLLAYESESGVLTPSELVKDHLRFVVKDFDNINLAEIKEACDVERAGVKSSRKEHRIQIRDSDDLLCEIYLPTFFTRYLDREPAQTLMEAFELPPVRGLTVSRDCKAIELTALDPRTYAMAANCLRNDDEIWAERADFAATMVRECWPEKFTADQDGVFADDPDAGWHRVRGPY